MKDLVLLTGSELRHDYVRKALARHEGLNVRQTWCEGLEKSLRAITDRDESPRDLRMKHLEARESSEREFFADFSQTVEDQSHPRWIPKGEINTPEVVEEIISVAPEVLVAYGSSIIKEPLLSAFEGRFVNVHLGLSPYYRGSGTNFWPLVNGEPEYVGVSFIHIDAGVDTGKIIHQIRARVDPGDTPSRIGNRLIQDMVDTLALLVSRFDDLVDMPQPPASEDHRYYRKKDFNEDSVAALYRRFDEGLVEQYLKEREIRETAVPIVINPALSERQGS